MINEADLSKMIKDAKTGDKERKFKQTLEMYVILKDIDVKKGFAMNETIQLPKKLSKPTTVCVMAGGDMGLKAKSANADRVVSSDEINTIAANKREARKFINNYDFFLADTQLMTTVGKVLGQLLGPRGKMPIPVPFNAPIDAFLDRFRSSIRVKVKNSLSMSCKIGDETMEDGDLAANAHAVLNAIEKKLPSGDKNIRRIIVKTSMGKPIKQVQQARK
ncbi:MAG: 50S ribosomal protein L1 [Nitrososphaeria archaeon]|nr:50S ribosomal protein L1 [Nitrososphaeria archaeon]NDB50588.1 50S ribosomal protein L1 [Nitrosopumilaceae archaeon]NDB87707.1 50S ribosomal protein L1 [Nitrososphaerota archaeon]NDB45690.1 50S ribosomal protein L1 [Nitrososphaeria archaeon]NDB62612.1 50S ribosomal protein L1 [Nitrosopumilaceae archaeon]